MTPAHADPRRHCATITTITMHKALVSYIARLRANTLSLRQPYLAPPAVGKAYCHEPVMVLQSTPNVACRSPRPDAT